MRGTTILILLAALLSGCAGAMRAPAPPRNSPTASTSPTSTAASAATGTPEATPTVAPTPLASPTPHPSPTPASQQIRAGAAAWVRVSVATGWHSPTSALPIDAPALAYPARIRQWLAALTHADQAGLIGRADTQVLLGDRVLVVALDGQWANVVVPNQPTPLDGRGYPAWIPIRQLSAVAPSAPAGAPLATVIAPTAWLLDNDGNRTFELSFGTSLGVIGQGTSRVRVALPAGGSGWLAEASVSVHASHTAALPASAASVLVSAKQFVGLRYLWAGTSGFGFDCSGLVSLIYRVHGITLPRDASPQSATGTPVAGARLEPGDLAFFVRDGSVHHVGIWAGGGIILEAPDIGVPVRLSSLSELPYAAEMTIARRVLR